MNNYFILSGNEIRITLCQWVFVLFIIEKITYYNDADDNAAAAADIYIYRGSYTRGHLI